VSSEATPPRKAAPKKAAPRKAPVKKAAPRKTAAKRTPAKKTTKTAAEAAKVAISKTTEKRSAAGLPTPIRTAIAVGDPLLPAIEETLHLLPEELLQPDPAGDEPAPGVSAWNAANALTALRIVLVPFFLLALLKHDGHQSSWRIWAWVIFAVAAITDRFDGQIARNRNLITNFGKVADPIADKALIGGALIALSGLDLLPWWVTIVVLARELGVTLLRFWVIRHGVIPASRGGKAKTLAQGLAIGFYVLPFTGWVATGRAYLMAVAVALTVLTGIDYVGRAVRLRRESTA
jgi:CDP-diacylglycerol--glycerol-3-phosphate 3-phosphatidyltransferase